MPGAILNVFDFLDYTYFNFFKFSSFVNHLRFARWIIYIRDTRLNRPEECLVRFARSPINDVYRLHLPLMWVKGLADQDAASAAAKQLGLELSKICRWKSSRWLQLGGCVCCTANWLWQEPMFKLWLFALSLTFCIIQQNIRLFVFYHSNLVASQSNANALF